MCPVYIRKQQMRYCGSNTKAMQSTEGDSTRTTRLNDSDDRHRWKPCVFVTDANATASFVSAMARGRSPENKRLIGCGKKIIMKHISVQVLTADSFGLPRYSNPNPSDIFLFHPVASFLATPLALLPVGLSHIEIVGPTKGFRSHRTISVFLFLKNN